MTWFSDSSTRYKNRNAYNATTDTSPMSEDATSTSLDDGGIGCSRCRLPLTETHSPFYIRKEYVGHFDSLDCPLCHFHIFTEKGYGDAMQMAHGYGLVGPPEEVEMCDTVQAQDTFGSITSRVIEERLAIMTVQRQISFLQFTESCNRHKINHDDESVDALRGLLNNIIVPVQYHLKAIEQLVVVDVK